MKGCCLAVRMRNIVNAVFQDLNFVSLLDQRIAADADFALTCCRHFVVMHFQHQSPFAPLHYTWQPRTSCRESTGGTGK
jgi:hypothetical protein